MSFNQDYFGGYPGFKLRKGDIIANEPGLTIKLNTILEKNMAGVVFINSNSAITEPTCEGAGKTAKGIFAFIPNEEEREGIEDIAEGIE